MPDQLEPRSCFRSGAVLRADAGDTPEMPPLAVVSADVVRAPYSRVRGSAVVVSHGVLKLTLADGTTGEVDLLDRMRGPVFEETRTPQGLLR